MWYGDSAYKSRMSMVSVCWVVRMSMTTLVGHLQESKASN
jgi:hypothetical protein